MGRYIGPACKRCRRQGIKLFLKGDRCYMAKCAIEQGMSAPGQHGARRGRKMSEYGEQLRQKQSIQEYYHSRASLARAMTRLKATSGK